MEISWFEIVAQIINFFILLFILNKLFYDPVTKAMASRRERIFRAEKAANKKMQQAEMLIENYDKKIKNVEKEEQRIFDQYRKEALVEKTTLLEKYEEEASAQRQIYFSEVEEEKEYFIKRLRRELGKNAVDIASKILSTISSKDLEKEVFVSFINKLETLDEMIPNKDLLNKHSKIDLSSNKVLSEAKKDIIENALKVGLSHEGIIEYRIDESLIIGYELNLETYTFHNSIKTYLDEVEHNISNLIESQ